MVGETCGKCRFGDYFRCGGKERVGNVDIPGTGLVGQVLCRYTMGLTLRTLPETSTCRHRPSVFEPRPLPVLINNIIQEQPAA